MIPATVFHGMRELARMFAGTTPKTHWQTNPAGFAAAIVDAELGTEGVCSHDPYIESVARSAYINVLVAGLWNLHGRPVVSLGHNTAAACASTRVYADAVELIRPPWPAFIARLPQPFLSVVDSRGISRQASTLMVATLPDESVHSDDHQLSGSFRWWYKVCADYCDPDTARESAALRKAMTGLGSILVGLEDGVSIWGFNLPPKGMLLDLTKMPWERWDQLEVATSDERVDMLARQLALNLCLYCDAPNAPGRFVDSSIKLKSRTSKPDELGTYTRHDLNAGIKLNLVEPVRQYLATGRLPPSYRTLVTPHWKRVAHGPGRELRRLRFIDAYWRGEERPTL